MSIRSLKVGPALGYSGMRVFATAEQALRWCAPDREMLVCENWPAESWRIKSFSKQLTVNDVLEQASGFPEKLKQLPR